MSLHIGICSHGSVYRRRTWGRSYEGSLPAVIFRYVWCKVDLLEKTKYETLSDKTVRGLRNRE